MMDKHLNHVNNNLIYCDNILYYAFEDFRGQQLAFDTESCTDTENDENGARVYAWSLGATNTDTQIYGHTLDQFYNTLVLMADHDYEYTSKLKHGKQQEIIIKFPIGVHNLGWDIEFFKYFLEDEKGFTYDMGQVVEYVKPVLYEGVEIQYNLNTYNIAQNDGIVYGCEFCFLEKTFKTKKGKEYKIKYICDMWDTLKVMNCSIDKIDSFCSDLKPMFKKLSSEYDYELWRSPHHKLTDIERQYLYNDVYRLSKALEQFYLPMCERFDLKPSATRTASSMAFGVLKKMTFTDEQEYINYFGIGSPCSFPETRKRLEDLSYQGGYTHINFDIIDKEIGCLGSSWDINSSYPTQMAYKVLPYGSPIKLIHGVIPKEVDNKNHVALIEIAFDFVRPKKSEYNLPIFKIGQKNVENFKKYLGNEVSGNEYFSTNMFDEIIPISSDIENATVSSNYKKVITSVEYDFLIKHFDFGTFKKNKKVLFDGLEIGSVMVYKAEQGKLKRFVEHFTKMKILYKGSKPSEIKKNIENDKNYYNGILTSQEVETALIEGIQKDDSLVAFAKLCLNSSYGKFGSKADRNITNTITDEYGIKRFTTSTDKENHISEDYQAKEYYRPMASFITAYGRLQIWNAILSLGIENFLYTDTDSIYCTLSKEVAEKRLLKGGFDIDKKILGAFDNEHNFKKFKGLSQKKYMLQEVTGEIDCRCSGCPKDVQKELCKEGFGGFYLGREIEGKKQKVKVIGGLLLKNVKFSISKFSF